MTARHRPDANSFEEFARASQRRLYRTAYLLCGDAEAARDLTQTTLAKLFQHWGRASAADHPHAYARTVLTRTYIAERRRRLRDLRILSAVTLRRARTADRYVCGLNQLAPAPVLIAGEHQPHGTGEGRGCPQEMCAGAGRGNAAGTG
nr:hypothetical protein OG461_15535 [Streptomyces sp. NBC_00995]